MNVATAMLPREDERNLLDGGDGSRGAEEKERLRRMIACAAEEDALDDALVAAAAGVLRGAIILLHDEEVEEARAAFILVMLICFRACVCLRGTARPSKVSTTLARKIEKKKYEFGIEKKKKNL